MSEYVVLDHRVDGPEGVYRLIIGARGEAEQQKLQDGKPMIREDGLAVTETVELILWQEEFVFAADDLRWADKSPEQIAAEQREEVAGQIKMREEAEEQAKRAAEQAERLPGVGDTL